MARTTPCIMTETESETPKPAFSNPVVVQDPMRFHGGGIQYTLELARTLDCPLYTYEHTADIDTDDVDVIEFGDPSTVDRLIEQFPFGSTRLFVAYENLQVPAEFDAVITSGPVSKSVVHRDHQQRFHALHTPTRWLFDRAPGRYADSPAPIRWLRNAYQSLMRIYDVSTISRIDDFIPNSEVIERRLETYYRREASAIVHPPVDTSSYHHEESEGFLLSLGRLEKLKHVDEVVKAVNETDRHLVVAGTGAEESRLRQIAGPNVEFRGFVSEDEKRDLLARCEAVIFAAEREDFGIVPVEALAAGKPVVGVNEGFTKFQIEDGETGILFDRGIENLHDAIDCAYDTNWDRERIQNTSKRFDVDVFRKKWSRIISGSCEE